MKDRFSDVNTLLEKVSINYKVPGVATAAIVDGEIACIATYGYRDLEKRLPMEEDTPSRWYSISKPLTALAIAKLVFEGKLKWDQPVSELIDGLRFEDPIVTKLATIADCLLHRTGLSSGNWTWFGTSSDPHELLRRLPYFPCRCGFRTGYHYQNLHFTILGEVFKAVGTDWHSAIRDLLEPLGVRPLTRLKEFISADRAIGYGPSALSEPVRADDFDFEGIASASAVCGSIKELALVACAVAKLGKGWLPKQAWEEAINPVFVLPKVKWFEMQMPAAAYAGRMIIYRGHFAIQWAGGFTGYGSHLVAIPSLKIAACGLSNRTANPAADALTWEMIDRAAGWELCNWADRFLEYKKESRKKGEKDLSERLNRPVAPWPVKNISGCYIHNGYGELYVTEDNYLVFRNIKLPLIMRPNGIACADGSTSEFSEICWDLRPEIKGDEIIAWWFNPDNPSFPCRFEKVK